MPQLPINIRSRSAKLVVAGAASVGVLVSAWGTGHGAGNPPSGFGTIEMRAGANFDTTCPNPITNTNLGAGEETVTCTDVAATTTVPPTTTTVPESTTTVVGTTVPSTTTVPATTTVPVTPSACKFAETGNPAAVCQTFNTPTPTPGTRSGDLDGVLWGVSRATSASNTGQHQSYDWAASTQNDCGTNTVVKPETDIRVCNGQMVESSNDSTNQTVLAAYPRQPFDFAARTGTVAFDVSDNTQGVHSSWPDFLITDQPVPAPNSLLSGVADSARNSVGVELAQVNCDVSLCGHGANQDTCVGVSSIFDTSNYQYNNLGFSTDGCVKPSSGPGNNNHVEVQVNSAGLKVFMADAGNPAAIRQVAHASFTVPLSRGLVWLEDVHYNANKFNTQQTNTFTWDNVAFDGPVLPRDLGFDIPDNTANGGSAANGQPMADLGYLIPQNGGTLTLTVPGVHNTAQAAAALLEFTFGKENNETISYSVNGGAFQSWADPFGASFVSETVALPVPLSQVHDGNNTIALRTSDSNGNAVANFDLILAAAGGTIQP